MKNTTIDKYLVPYDFTPATKEAYHYALTLAKTAGGEVMLAHIVKEEAEIPSAKRELEKFIALQTEDAKAITDFRVMEGSVYEDINQIAETAEASAIVMGTHGKTGLQNVFGSNALKIVADSHIPFIIVQEGVDKSQINDIVMPFSFERESLQITQFATAMAKTFDATIHLVGFRDHDDSLFHDMKINQAIVQKYLVQQKIKYKIVTLPSKDNYETELLEYAHTQGADLFAAAYFDQGFRSFFHSFVDELINNKYKIPVITVNGPEVMNHSPRLTYFPI
ncbi:MAG: universal stress protein [Crocinitomicaceae bacterium]